MKVLERSQNLNLQLELFTLTHKCNFDIQYDKIVMLIEFVRLHQLRYLKLINDRKQLENVSITIEMTIISN
jgi:hypothetical protein